MELIKIYNDNFEFICVPAKKSDKIEDLFSIELAEQVMRFYPSTTVYGKYSELTDSECEGLVVWSEFDEGVKLYQNYNNDNWLHDSRKSLESLFRSKKVFIKEWLTEPKMNHWGATSADYDQFFDDKNEYNNTPEDYLIIVIN